MDIGMKAALAASWVVVATLTATVAMTAASSPTTADYTLHDQYELDVWCYERTWPYGRDSCARTAIWVGELVAAGASERCVVDAIKQRLQDQMGGNEFDVTIENC